MAQVKLTRIKKLVAGQTLFEAEGLTADTGEIVGIVGNNGAGKTTLMRIIAQQDKEFKGQRLVQGTVTFVHQVNPLTDQSGGQATVSQIRTALSQRPDILILDEPTANLDERHQDWLVQQVRKFRGLLLVISHDRHFLAQVATKIWAIANHEYMQFDGGLAAFEALEEQHQANQLQAYRHQHQKEHALKLAVQARKEKAGKIRRGSRKMGRVELAKTKTTREQNAGKMERSAHALLERAAKQTTITKPFQSSPIKLMPTDFPVFTGKTVVSVNQFDLIVADKYLLQQATFQIKPSERVALVGPNGIGKTTLIRAILTRQPQTKLSTNARVGYFKQDITQLPMRRLVWPFLQRVSVLDDNRTRQVMGAFGITSRFYQREIGALSGGEQVKLQLLSILLSDSNFLILDEPTNFLDEQALDALAAYLKRYPGTVLLVSHDLAFRHQVATRTLLFQKQRLIDPNTTTLHAKQPSNLPLLQLRYDQLMMSANASTQELRELKQQIETLK